jgi:hypothetical protein
LILVSDRVIYSDGAHNMVPRIARWRGRFWMVFRNASGHRSGDGRILVAWQVSY